MFWNTRGRIYKRFIRLHTKTMRTSFSQTYTLHNYKGIMQVLYVQHNTSDRKYVYACFFFVNLYSFMHLAPGDPKLLLCAWVSVVLMTLNWLGLNWGQSRESKHPAASANQRNKASEYRTEICLQRHPQSSTCSNPNYLCEWVCFGVWPFVGKVASCSRIKNNFEAQVANWIMCISSCNVTSLLIHWNAWNQQLL